MVGEQDVNKSNLTCMNKKTLIIVAVVALAIGGLGSIALQSHAQNTVSQPSSVVPSATVSPVPENTTTDTDNIQNDTGGVDKPDAAVSGSDTKEQGDQGTANTPEVEDGN